MFYAGSMKNVLFLVISAGVLLSVVFCAKQSHAADMATVQDLDFGQFAVLNNTSVHTIVVTAGGSVTYDPVIIPGIQAQRAQYTLTGFPPSQAIDVTIDNTENLSLDGGGTGTMLSVGSYTTNSPSTNGAGNATLYIGATLSTSGSGAYSNGDYEGSVDLTFNF